MANKAVIISEINAHVAKSGKPHADWYVGIATDVRKRLFEEHGVDQKGWWIYREADSELVAREAEAELLKLGYDGGTGGGDRPRYVYAYLKGPNTRE